MAIRLIFDRLAAREIGLTVASLAHIAFCKPKISTALQSAWLLLMPVALTKFLASILRSLVVVGYEI